MVDDDGGPTPPVVTAAVSIGTAPLPFLAVYAALFLLHGAVHPVHPPDITNSQDGELVAGVITTVIFVIATASLVQFLNRHRRWPYAVVQLAVLGGCVDVLVDSTRGGRPIAGLLVATTVVSLVFGFAPDSWTHVGRATPSWVARLYRPVSPAGAAGPSTPSTDPVLPQSSPPSMAEPASLRRRRFSARGPREP
ncbi:hypothetical protein [Jatrophihabitans endophyticus]|uniref:hypothetical protein n=1 Tax=Jatrophihabitans endophyticus TaxID=1206085 RepID=UPI0019DC3A7D|nr:hypothetical protein [Jatrophihabitans endophyticus]MBE7186974.1 hypothetical protein [Jatrophihabitans endophyticus]